MPQLLLKDIGNEWGRSLRGRFKDSMGAVAENFAGRAVIHVSISGFMHRHAIYF